MSSNFITPLVWFQRLFVSYLNDLCSLSSVAVSVSLIACFLFLKSQKSPKLFEIILKFRCHIWFWVSLHHSVLMEFCFIWMTQRGNKSFEFENIDLFIIVSSFLGLAAHFVMFQNMHIIDFSKSNEMFIWVLNII